MSGSPTMSGTIERQNIILKDMIRSMINHSTLSESLCGEALKTVTYILTKFQPKQLKRRLMSNKKL